LTDTLSAGYSLTEPKKFAVGIPVGDRAMFAAWKAHAFASSRILVTFLRRAA